MAGGGGGGQEVGSTSIRKTASQTKRPSLDRSHLGKPDFFSRLGSSKITNLQVREG